MGPTPERLKLHRRSLQLDGQAYTVLAPRPDEASRFATDTDGRARRIITDTDGALLLGRLCWAMAYQTRARTITVIDPSFLLPNPFDAEPSSPVAIVNGDLGPLASGVVDDLAAQLPLAAPSSGTVVLQTRGLGQALADPVAFAQRDDQVAARIDGSTAPWIDGEGDVWVLAAPPPVLRAWGVALSDLAHRGLDGGECSVMPDLADRVERSIVRRNDLFPGRSSQALSDDERHEMRAQGTSGRSSDS